MIRYFASERTPVARVCYLPRQCAPQKCIIPRGHQNKSSFILLRRVAAQVDPGSTIGSSSNSSRSGGGHHLHSGDSTMSPSNSNHPDALSIINAHGERLAAKLVDVSSEGIVILCHGYAATKVRHRQTLSTAISAAMAADASLRWPLVFLHSSLSALPNGTFSCKGAR